MVGMEKDGGGGGTRFGIRVWGMDGRGWHEVRHENFLRIGFVKIPVPLGPE